MASRSKQKGSQFERDMCRALSSWVSDGKRDGLFWRSAMSGGRATLAAKKGIVLDSQVGDICAIHSEGELLTRRFAIECKHLRDLNLATGLLTGRGVLIKEFRVIANKAQMSRREPMLLARQNRFPILVVTSEKGRKLLFPKQRRPATVIVELPTQDAVVFLWDEVRFQAVPPARW